MEPNVYLICAVIGVFNFVLALLPWNNYKFYLGEAVGAASVAFAYFLCTLI